MYECTEGCIHDGVVERVCQGNNQWSGDVPHCKSKLISSLIVISLYIVRIILVEYLRPLYTYRHVW